MLVMQSLSIFTSFRCHMKLMMDIIKEVQDLKENSKNSKPQVFYTSTSAPNVVFFYLFIFKYRWFWCLIRRFCKNNNNNNDEKWWFFLALKLQKFWWGDCLFVREKVKSGQINLKTPSKAKLDAWASQTQYGRWNNSRAFWVFCWAWLEKISCQCLSCVWEVSQVAGVFSGPWGISMTLLLNESEGLVKP